MDWEIIPNQAVGFFSLDVERWKNYTNLKYYIFLHNEKIRAR